MMQSSLPKSASASIGLAVLMTLLILPGCSDGGGEADVVSSDARAKGVFLELTPEVAVMTHTGDRLTLGVSIKDSRGRTVSSPVTYRSLNPEVAIVDHTGMVTGITEGIAAIVGKASAAEDTAVVAVAARKLEQGSASVVVFPNNDTIPVIGGELLLQAVAREPNNRLVAGGNLKWTSLNPEIASVSQSGVVHGLASGRAGIRAATAKAADTAWISVAPNDYAVKLTVAPRVDTIPSVGGSLELTASLVAGDGSTTGGSITWSSLDRSIAIVEAGRVIGMAKGAARIRASSGSLADTALIHVAPVLAPARVEVQPRVDTIATLGGTTQLTANISDPNGATVTSMSTAWSTLDAQIVSVSSTGLVKGLSKGVGRVVAKAGTAADTATITVAPDPSTLPPAKIVLSPAGGKVAVGKTLALFATVTDSKGTVLQSAPIAWQSQNTSKATVSGNADEGTVTGVAAGEVRIIASAGSVADTANIAVSVEDEGEGAGSDTVAVAVSIAPRVDTIATVGGTTDLTARLLNSEGSVLQGTLSWASLDAGIATVNNSGTVNGVAQGLARITATYVSMIDTAWVYVQPTGTGPVAAMIDVSPTTTSTNVGGTVLLNAVVRDSLGGVLPVTPVWSSANPGIATVNSGVVAGKSAGTAQIIASHKGLADTATIQVHAPPPPAPGYTVDLQIVRWDGRAGAALVSSAIPLPPGVLMPSQAANVHIMVNGTEQPVYAEALYGLFADGSVRSVLVQFQYNVASGSIPAQMVISSPRALPSPAKVPVKLTLSAPYPEAAILPTDPHYLRSTKIVGPAVTLSEAVAFSPTWVQRWNTVGDAKILVQESDYKTVDTGWIVHRNYYDRALANFAHWVMTGNAEYFRRALLYAVPWRERYHRPNGYTVQPHETHIEGQALLYTLLGDEEGRRGPQLHAEYMRDLWLPKLVDPLWQHSANRPMARAIESYITAMKVGVPGNWPATLRHALNVFLAHQHADGAYRYPAQCNYSNHFQTGLFNDALIRYWEEFEQDPRIPVAIKRSADWLWNSQWVASGGGFKYSEGPCSLPGAGATETPAPDLNLLIVNTYGFLYQQTGDVQYRNIGDTVFHEGIKRAWLGGTPTQGDKQFNQQFRSAFRYFHYRK